jgi:hypothetical protein
MARIELLLERLKLLERKYSFELALYELESLAGFRYLSLSFASVRQVSASFQLAFS